MSDMQNRNSQEEMLTLGVPEAEPSLRERMASLLRRAKPWAQSEATAGALEFCMPFVLVGAFLFVAFCPEHDFSVKVLPAVHVDDHPGGPAGHELSGKKPDSGSPHNSRYTVFKPGEIRAFCNQGGPERWTDGSQGVSAAKAEAGESAGPGHSPSEVLPPVYGGAEKKFCFGEDGAPGEQDIREEIRLAQLQLEAGHVDSALGDLERLGHYADMPGFPADLRQDILVAVMDASRLRLLSDGESAAPDLRRACAAVIDEQPQSAAAAEALRNLSLVSQIGGDFPAALDYLLAACERFPESGGMDREFLNLGTAAAAAGKQSEAVRAFQELLRRFPSSPLAADAWAGTARSRAAQGSFAEAGRAFAMLADNQDYFLKAPDVLLEWARNEVRTDGGSAAGKISEIYRRFASLDLLGDQADEVHLGFGDLMYRAGMEKDALSVWHRLGQGHSPSSCTARMRLLEGRVIDLPADIADLKTVFAKAPQKKLLELYRLNMASCPGSRLAETCRVREIYLLSAQGYVHEARDRAVEFLRESAKSGCAPLVADCLRSDLKREVAFMDLPRDYFRLASAWEETPEIRKACGTPDPDMRAALGRGFLLMGKKAEAAAILEPLLENRAMDADGLYALSCCYNEALARKDWKKLLHIADCVSAWPLPEGLPAQLAYSSAVAYQALGNRVRALASWRSVCEDESAREWQRGYAAWYLACDASARKDSKASYAWYCRTVSFFEAAARQGSEHVDNELLTGARRRLAAICDHDGRKREAMAWLAQIPQKQAALAAAPAGGGDRSAAGRDDSGNRAQAPLPESDLLSAAGK